MKISVGKAASLAGVSVRTLRYYDEIGLLKPDEISEAGYRYYEDASIERLQQIVFFRELGFSLNDIIKILGASDYDAQDMMKKHRNLLALKKQEIEEKIRITDALIGGDNMKKSINKESEYEKKRQEYADEVKKRWGNTEEYRQSSEKEKNRTTDEDEKIASEAEEIFKKFSELRNCNADDSKVQELVREWQNHISKYYYQCNNEILACLGEMYIADERFKENLDSHGEGTAELMTEAIREYVKL